MFLIILDKIRNFLLTYAHGLAMAIMDFFMDICFLNIESIEQANPLINLPMIKLSIFIK